MEPARHRPARRASRSHPLTASRERPVVVVGATLGGLAAAARLARAGHHVVVLDRDQPPATPGLSRPVICLPAAWRDLFRKSGRVLDAALAAHGYELVSAPPTRHLFADGSSVDLPTDRGEQHAALARLAGDRSASAWRDLVDDADETWQLVRRVGLETEADLTDPRTARLLADRRTVESEARRLSDPRLAALVRSVAYRLGSAPEHTPYWLLSRLSVERTFGHWLVVRDGVPQPSEVLTEALVRRLAERDVELRWGVQVTDLSAGRVATRDGGVESAAVVSAVGHAAHAMLTGRPTEIAVARLGRLRLGARRASAESPLSSTTEGPQTDRPVEVVRHGTKSASVTWTLPGRTVTATGAPTTAGLRWRGPATVRAFHQVDAGPCVYAGSGGIGGAEPWAQLLAGALAAYRTHAALTGEDIRPSNRAYRP